MLSEFWKEGETCGKIWAQITGAASSHKKKGKFASVTVWQASGGRQSPLASELADGGTWLENKETTRGHMMGESQQPCGFTLPVSRSVIPLFLKVGCSALCPRDSPAVPLPAERGRQKPRLSCLQTERLPKALLHEYIFILLSLRQLWKEVKKWKLVDEFCQLLPILSNIWCIYWFIFHLKHEWSSTVLSSPVTGVTCMYSEGWLRLMPCFSGKQGGLILRHTLRNNYIKERLVLLWLIISCFFFSPGLFYGSVWFKKQNVTVRFCFSTKLQTHTQEAGNVRKQNKKRALILQKYKNKQQQDTKTSQKGLNTK